MTKNENKEKTPTAPTTRNYNSEEIPGRILDDRAPRVFETGAQRDSDSLKPFIHMLRGYTRQRFGYHLNTGSHKYGNANFLKGMSTEVALESMDRHLAALLEGDRSEDHPAAIIFGAQLIMLNEQKEGIPSNHYFNKSK